MANIMARIGGKESKGRKMRERGVFIEAGNSSSARVLSHTFVLASKSQITRSQKTQTMRVRVA